MEDSIFTKIIKGEIPSYKIYEDEKTYAFLDINPLRPGHTLVVPKVQVDNLWDLPDEDYVALNDTVKKIAKYLEENIDCERVGVLVEGFEVPHAHIHLIPLDKGFRMTYLENDKNPASSDNLAEMAEKLRMN